MTRVALGITGASGALYAVRTLAALLAHGAIVELVVSDYGRRLLRDEIGPEAAIDRLAAYVTSRYAVEVAPGRLIVHSNRDLGATLASGSQGCEAMVIVPCSMKTLAGIAHGLSRSLIERAADVMLKERRPLVLVPRETPLSAIHLENMLRLRQAGATILFAAPGFYHGAESVSDLVDFVVGRCLDQLGLDNALIKRWGDS
jgi:flavin prenyltransferase